MNPGQIAIAASKIVELSLLGDPVNAEVLENSRK